MKSCPNCGWPNEDQHRFCENCGADFAGLEAQGRMPPPRPSGWREPAAAGSSGERPLAEWEVPPSSPDWRMAPLPPEDGPGRRGRRVWLWIVGGVLLFCVLIWVGGIYWYAYTDSGQNYQTQVAEREEERDAERATEDALTASPSN